MVKLIEAKLHLLKNGPVGIPLPDGTPARIIMPDGSMIPATKARLVPGGKGVTTAYPIPKG